MTCIKIVCGDEEKIIDVDIEKLKELDEQYFECVSSDKFKKEEYIEYGLDEKYESIEGFVRFFDDYSKYKEPKLFHIKSQLDVQVLQTAYRYKKLRMYIFQQKDTLYIDPFIFVKYSSEFLFHKIIEKIALPSIKYTTWEYLKEGLRCFELLPYQIKRIYQNPVAEIELYKDEKQIYRLDTFQHCSRIDVVCKQTKTEFYNVDEFGYSIYVKYIKNKYQIKIVLYWEDERIALKTLRKCYFGYGKGVKVDFSYIIKDKTTKFTLSGDSKEHTFYLDKSYKYIENCKDQVLKFE